MKERKWKTKEEKRKTKGETRQNSMTLIFSGECEHQEHPQIGLKNPWKNNSADSKNRVPVQKPTIPAACDFLSLLRCSRSAVRFSRASCSRFSSSMKWSIFRGFPRSLSLFLSSSLWHHSHQEHIRIIHFNNITTGGCNKGAESILEDSMELIRELSNRQVTEKLETWYRLSTYPLFRLFLFVDHSCQSRRHKWGNISAEPTLFISPVAKTVVNTESSCSEPIW